MSSRLGVILCLSVVLFVPSVAFGFTQENVGTETSPEDAEVSRKASSIARQTMSPFCPGRTLSDCPSEYAAEWRRDIRKMVQDGMTAEEIQRELEARAGGNLSGIPNREASYALPLGLATGAALFLYFIFMRLRRKEEGGPKKEGKPEPQAGAAKPDQEGSARDLSVDDERLERELESEEDF